MYDIVIVNDAEVDIRQIISFIARDYFEKLMTAINSLKQFPERGSTPRYKIVRNQGYKYIVVKSHLIFYLIDHDNKRIAIIRVLHHKTSYQNFL